MPSTAFALVAAAAVFHALWNLIAKRMSGNLAVSWIGLCFASLMLLPVAGFSCNGLDTTGLLYMATTGLIHSAYFGFLAAAYRHGEMSVVYPLARGSNV